MEIYTKNSNTNSEEYKLYNERINNLKKSQEIEELNSKNPAKFYEDFLNSHKDEIN